MITRWPFKSMGCSSSPALLFLHGFMGTGMDWHPIATYFAGQYFCLLPDLPGHGQNTRLLPQNTLDFDTVCTGLKQLLLELKLQKVTLVGYSMGGRVALYFTVKFPQHVEKLVVESANPGIQDPAARTTRAALDDQRALQILAGGINDFVEGWYNLDLFASLKRFPRRWANTKTHRKQNNPQWAAKVIREMSPGRQPPLWRHLSQLKIPVLLLAGMLDTKYATLVSQMGKLIPQASVQIVPNAGHNIHLEQPQMFANYMGYFLQ